MPKKEMAADIAANLMTRTRDALMARDFDAFIACFHLPVTVETVDGRQEVRNRAEARTVFDGLVSAFDAQNLTWSDRRLAQTDVISDARIEFVYLAQNFRGRDPVGERYPNFCQTRRIGEEWRITYSMHAVPVAFKHRDALLGAGTPLPA
ncbi:hypothetical protein KDD17_13000 [Sulfitobacter albidus]|uniref:Uncharacterized protein n=1 Tax=Sulfitobacter albidus TaxID=2829501 RepID=A0A975JCD3_9RHOB|nr:hypothetical protein [Sulfitobacter albidus]QUJ75848.1 hypothetical protein KDD17_13000 [Sulfitobacter albidus]